MAAMQRRAVHPADAVVLLPYAQLMQQARQAWAIAAKEADDEADSAGASIFVPRFETTMNWASSLGGRLGPYTPLGADIRMDVAVDMLTAASLLQRAGLGAQQDLLAGRLVEAAWSLARVAAAVPPAARTSWGEQLAPGLSADMDGPVLAVEARLGRIALAWAAASSYPTDCLFDAKPAFFAVLEGFQPEPLSDALKAHFGNNSLSITLCAASDLVAAPTPFLHQAPDAEDEAARAAACVLAHLAQGRSPVALVAVDRVLTRRVRAMLADRGLAVRDETGWKLSTTRAAATLMGLLRACAWDASTDAVLDWLKNSPAFDARAITQSETQWRKAGLREWRRVSRDDGLAGLPDNALANLPGHALIVRANAVRDALQRSRPLTDWLRDLRTALQSAGQWPGLAADGAGQAVLQALRLPDGLEQEFAAFTTRESLSEFTAWVSQTLEAADFKPAHPAQEQVVILPLSQLLGRPLPAVVLPGCDEVRLQPAPEPPGEWTPAQRELLGLPSREHLASVSRRAWHYALRSPHIDLLWRQSEGGERLMPSGFVQELMLQHATDMSPDPRALRELVAVPCVMPQPQGDALPVARLSASAYEDLRRCPYRFFALRQLKLQESDELDNALGKREFGNWLHSLLKRFHEALKAAPALEYNARIAIINVASDEAAAKLGLTSSEFLPFAAAWPSVRAGYLQWLATHEASGAAFEVGEAWKETPLGAVTLVGRIDRIDRLPDGSALVIDYKTEGRGVTSERIKTAFEDTQLAFYAALLTDDTLAAAYVNVGEKDATKTYAQPDIGALRDQLIEGIVDDMSRIRGGAAMPALGEGKACNYCAARGLCRKDFWTI